MGRNVLDIATRQTYSFQYVEKYIFS